MKVSQNMRIIICMYIHPSPDKAKTGSNGWVGDGEGLIGVGPD